MKPMIKIVDEKMPLYAYEAISGNVTLRADRMCDIVGSTTTKRWRPLTRFEKIKPSLGFDIKNLDYVGD